MLKKVIHTFGFRAFSAVINLLIAILLSQYLGPSGKGTQSIILTTISFILIFSNLVGGATLVYLVPRFKVSLLLLPSYAWSVLIAALSYILLIISGLVDQGYILHICLLSLMSAFLSIHSNLLVGKQKIIASNYLVLLQSVLLMLFLFLTFALNGVASISDYIVSLYISIGVCLALSLFLIRKLIDFPFFPGFSEYKPVISQMTRLGFQNQVAHITQLLSFRLSYYVLEEYNGLAAVGVYSNGVSIAESIWLVAKSMAVVQYSWVSNSNDRTKSARMSVQLIKGGTLLSFLLIIPLALLPVSFYTVVFGTGFEGVRPVIWTLLPGILIYNVSILLGHYYSGTGRYYRNTTVSAMGLGFSAILYFLLIPALPVYGAGIATSISYLLTSLMFMLYFRKEYPGALRGMIPSMSDFSELKREFKGFAAKQGKADSD